MAGLSMSAPLGCLVLLSWAGLGSAGTTSASVSLGSRSLAEHSLDHHVFFDVVTVDEQVAFQFLPHAE